MRRRRQRRRACTVNRVWPSTETSRQHLACVGLRNRRCRQALRCATSTPMASQTQAETRGVAAFVAAALSSTAVAVSSRHRNDRDHAALRRLHAGMGLPIAAARSKGLNALTRLRAQGSRLRSSGLRAQGWGSGLGRHRRSQPLDCTRCSRTPNPEPRIPNPESRIPITMDPWSRLRRQARRCTMSGMGKPCAATPDQRGTARTDVCAPSCKRRSTRPKSSGGSSATWRAGGRTQRALNRRYAHHTLNRPRSRANGSDKPPRADPSHRCG